jgi:hypothetical protein
MQRLGIEFTFALKDGYYYSRAVMIVEYDIDV